VEEVAAMSGVDDAMRDLRDAQQQWAEAQGKGPEHIAAAKDRRELAIETALEAGVDLRTVSEATGLTTTEIRRITEEVGE
jgi:hypothetical protein